MARAAWRRTALVALVATFHATQARRGRAETKSAEPKGEADWYQDSAATHTLYAALDLPWNATQAAVAAAYKSKVQALEKSLRRDPDAWFASQKDRGRIYELVFTALDADADGALNASEASELLESLGFTGDADAAAAVDAWRAKTLPRAKRASYFASAAHLLATSTFATLHEASSTLGDAAKRGAYDAQERERAAVYAEDVARAGTWRASLARFLGTFVVFALGALAAAYACLFCAAGGLWLVCAVLAKLSGGARVAGWRDRLGAGVKRWKPRWEYVVAVVVLAPESCAGVVLVLAVGAAYVGRVLAGAASASALPGPNAVKVAKCVAAAAVAAKVAKPLARVATAPGASLRAAAAATRRAASRGLAGAKRVASAAAWTLVPWLFWSYLSSFLEEHLFSLLAGAAVVLVAVRPAREAALSALGGALADAGLAPRPEHAPEVDRVLARVAGLEVVTYEAPELLGDAALRYRVEAAGFVRPRDAPPPTRAELLGAFGDAYGACSVCMGEFEPGDATKRIDPCAHVFHADCLQLWVQQCAKQTKIPTCPYCTTLL